MATEYRIEGTDAVEQLVAVMSARLRDEATKVAREVSERGGQAVCYVTSCRVPAGSAERFGALMERTQAAIVEALILAAVASGDVTLPGADEGGAA